MTKIKQLIRRLAKQLSAALAVEPRCKGMQAAPPRYRHPQNDDTEGYWVAIGTLGKGVRVELWLDQYAGLSSPRAWCGLSSSSAERISQLLKQAALRSLQKKLLRRSGRDITKRPPYRFSRPLAPKDFDILVHEHYTGQRDYLGMFLNYPWPLSGPNRRALVRDAANLVSKFCAAVKAIQGGSRQGIRIPGPWARPDGLTEKAAVRHVRRFLKDIGYTVKSREQEICGYDLHATRDEAELHIEVKGCADGVPRFFISRTELRSAQSDLCWRLAIITNGRERPRKPKFLTNRQMMRLFVLEPTQWEGNLQ